MSFVALPPAAAAGVGQPLTTHEPPGHDRSAHRGHLTTSPGSPTSALGHGHAHLTTTATTAPSTATNHAHNQLTTATTTAPSTATNHAHNQLTTATTTAPSTATNHDHKPLRHWHPAVSFPGAAVTGAAEAPRAVSC